MAGLVLLFLVDFGNGVGFSLQLQYIGLHRAVFLKRSFIYVIISMHLIFDFVVGNLSYLAKQDVEMGEEMKHSFDFNDFCSVSCS